MKKTGWFQIDGVQNGTRTIEWRTEGLKILKTSKTRSVLDIGCAEGLIGEWLLTRHLLDTSFPSVLHGIEKNTRLIDTAREYFKDKNLIDATFYDDDIDMPDIGNILDAKKSTLPNYNTVLLLGVLQKLTDPRPILKYACEKAETHLAIRIPADRVTSIIDANSELLKDFYLLKKVTESKYDYNGVLYIYRRDQPAEQKKTHLKYNIMKKTDISLTSFPKCGRTWIRYFLATYISKKYNTIIDLELTPVNTWYCTNRMSVDTPYIFINHNFFDLYQNELVPTEILFKEELQKKKNIFVIRNPFDTMVSYYHQKIHREEMLDSKISLHDFMLDKVFGIERYAEFMLQYIEFFNTLKTPKIVILYENMHRAPEDEFKKLISFIFGAVDDNLLQQSLNLSNFDHMRKSEITTDEDDIVGRLTTPNWDGNINSLKVRKGLMFDYKNEMQDITISQISNLPYTKKLLQYLSDNYPETLA